MTPVSGRCSAVSRLVVERPCRHVPWHPPETAPASASPFIANVFDLPAARCLPVTGRHARIAMECRAGLCCGRRQHRIESLPVEMPAIAVRIEDEMVLFELFLAPRGAVPGDGAWPCSRNRSHTPSRASGMRASGGSVSPMRGCS